MRTANTYTILIVEDDSANAHLYRTLLQASLQCGFPFIFRTEIVDRLALAVARLEAGNGIDLVILDLGLRDAIGFEGLDRILAFGNIPVAVITGSVDQNNAVRALERGAQLFYHKPLLSSPEHFIHSVWSAIHRQRYVNSLRQPPLQLDAKKPSKMTLAAIIAAASAVIAGLAELIRAWKSK